MNGLKMELYHDNFQNFKRYDIPKKRSRRSAGKRPQ